MSFVRIKRIKDIEYGYLVSNKWTKGGSRQKVSKYLGKIVRLDDTVSDSFDESRDDIQEYISKNSAEKIVDDMIENFLNDLGFVKEKDGRKSLLGNLVYDRKYKTVLNADGKPNVIFVNDGFFCHETIQEIYDFNYKGSEKQVGTRLANAFGNSGVPISSVLFIMIFQKIYTNEGISKIR